MSTNLPVRRRTKGSTAISVGKAMSQETPQEPNQSCNTPGEKPTPRKVLMPEIRQVMMQDKKKGRTMAA